MKKKYIITKVFVQDEFLFIIFVIINKIRKT